MDRSTPTSRSRSVVRRMLCAGAFLSMALQASAASARVCELDGCKGSCPTIPAGCQCPNNDCNGCSGAACTTLASDSAHASCVVPPGDFCPAPACMFSLVILPDTQAYADEDHHQFFDCQTEWIKKNEGALGVKFVLHEGDVVQSSGDMQLAIAKRAMCVLDGHVPFIISPGNHDVDGNGRFKDLNDYFPITMFEAQCGPDKVCKQAVGIPPQTGIYPIDYSYRVFEACGSKWMPFAIRFNPKFSSEQDPLLWAKAAANASLQDKRKILIVTHSFLSASANLTTNGNEIWENFARLYPTVFMTFNGHDTAGNGEDHAAHASFTNGNGQNAVMSMFANYQDASLSGPFAGTLEVVTICPSNGKVRVANYSPYTDTCFTSGNYTFPFEQNFACGDGQRDTTHFMEQCDDGNVLPADCCDGSCRFESNGSLCETDHNTCTIGHCNGSGVCNENICDVDKPCGECGHMCVQNGSTCSCN